MIASAIPVAVADPDRFRQAGDSSPLDCPEADVRLLLIYEDKAAAKRALDLSHRITSDLSPDSEPWLCRMDLLTQQPFRQSALLQAAEADMIVIAVRRLDALTEFSLWIGELAANARREAALVCVFDASSNESEAIALAQARLGQLARPARLGLFISGVDMSADRSRTRLMVSAVDAIHDFHFSHSVQFSHVAAASL